MRHFGSYRIVNKKNIEKNNKIVKDEPKYGNTYDRLNAEKEQEAKEVVQEAETSDLPF